MTDATKYLVVTAKKTKELERKVLEKLSEGYELQGGVSLAFAEGSVGCAAQAMIMIGKE